MESVFDQRRYLIPFRSSLLPQVFTDTLVIGAGVAGLRAAIAAAEHGEVIVLAKGDLTDSNTAWGQGGVASELPQSARSDFESHIKDTLVCGAGLCDGPAVRRVIDGGPARLKELLDWGIVLDRDAQGKLAVGREGGHSEARIFHAMGDATGRELARCLVERARKISAVRIFDRCFALDLITPSSEPGSPVMGAITWHPKFGTSDAVGGGRPSCPAAAPGRCIARRPTRASRPLMAMPWRIGRGATVADMAFMQFHPTTLYLPGAPRSLISEAVRGEGAWLLDAAGKRFMPEHHPLAELAPRDIVSRAIVRQIAKQGGQHVWAGLPPPQGICGPVPRDPCGVEAV
jgi:L-aspartate oxidase